MKITLKKFEKIMPYIGVSCYIIAFVFIIFSLINEEDWERLMIGALIHWNIALAILKKDR